MSRGENTVVPPRGVDLSELPQSWSWAYLGDILTGIVAGKSFRCEERPPTASEYGIVKVSAVTWGVYDEGESKTITDNERINRDYLVKPGDFLFSRANTIGLVGACLIVHNTRRKLLLSDKILRLEFVDGVKNWINWMLKSRLGRRQIEALSTGNQESMRNIGQEQIRRICIPVPPADEQSRIVAKIEELFSELDKGVEALTEAQRQLDAYKQSVLKCAFEGALSADWRAGRKSKAIQLAPSVDAEDLEPPSDEELLELPDLPAGWTYMRLGNFIERMDSGKSFRCNERTPTGNEIGVAKVSAVTWGEYNEDESKTCVDGDRVNPTLFIKSGDFLFSRANTIELVGACVIAKQVRRRVMLSDKTLRLVFSGVSPSYFLHYLRSRLGRAEIMRRSTGNQESMRNIGQDRIRNIIIPMCPRDEAEFIQGRIQEVLSEIEGISKGIESRIAESTALRLTILSKAFSGQLAAQDPKDEPASVLLERIRAEREGATTKKQPATKNGKKKAA